MELRVEYIDPGQLKPYAGNARTHSELQVSQIAASMQQFGFVNPVLADDNFVVIAGHGRLEAAKLIGLTSVPVIRISHLSERQRNALVLADNKIALNAGWDFAKLSDELSNLVDADFDVSGLGFDEQELDALLRTDSDVLPSTWQDVPGQQPNSGAGASVLPVQPPAPVPPTSQLPEYDATVKTTYCCPSCGYRWSGKTS